MVESIVKSFDIWTDAQGVKSKGRVKSIDNISLEGIQHLRELVLELAIRGKLLPQDPADEAAGDSLQKTKELNEALVKEGKRKKSKALPDIREDEQPFDLPDGWSFVRLNDIGDWGSGATPNRSNHKYYGGNIPWFKSGELSSDYIEQSEEFITELALKETSLRYNDIGDVLIAMYGATIGKTSILKVRATTNQAVCACTPFQCISNTYLLTLLKAYNARFTKMGAGGAQPNISREKIIATVIALPPIAEQHRIVAKVDELMALCDKLEQEKTASLKTHQTLVAALLQTLTAAKDDSEVEKAWHRLAPHFDTLFCTEDSIDQLKQTILQLAVMGRLVKQDPNDEPASELLKKIEREREKLVKEGKIKKEKPLPEINDDEKPFRLPKGWEWVRPEDFSKKITDGEHFRPPTQNTGVYFLSAKDIRDEGISLEDPLFISKKTAETALQRCNPEKGDILVVSRGATVGRMCTVDIDDVFCLLGSVILIKPMPMIVGNYLKVIMKSPYAFGKLVTASGSTAQPAIYLRDIKKIIFPIAPLAEQHRIVARVEELVAICDKLKRRLSRSQEIQSTLSRTIVENAVA